MLWTDRLRNVRIALVAAAVVIVAASLLVSYSLTRDLQDEERRNVEVWAEAMRAMVEADEETDLSLVLKVMESNHTIPVIVLDEADNLLDCRNVSLTRSERADSVGSVQRRARDMRRSGQVLRLPLSQPGSTESLGTLQICYGESVMLQRLARYPYIQLGVMAVFLFVAIFAILSSKRAEQNRVWVGLSRETAHQLGTPLSSLMGWSQILRETYPDDELLPEMEKDVERLQLVAERFSKIGSRPELVPSRLSDTLRATYEYMRRRAPEQVKVSLRIEPEAEAAKAMLCAPLYQWVLENLCRNAIDAIPGGMGRLSLSLALREGRAVILVTDTGKGIPRKDFKNVFRPGFTTKKRGWGLGLSLAKRIVEEYHGGRIYVRDSQPGHGTTFCIETALV
ncbi:MAG: HAMP domain-containing histidine kinase [Bacteroidaceae bacterium]|nr:HAMP domain-containing histidine kinase [Bacteroidaceae bacterium]